MDVKISTEHYDIIDSGSVIIPSGQNIEFKINELRFKIIFPQVVNESEEQQNSIEQMVKSDKEGEYLEISIVNLRSAFFATARQLMHLAKLEGRKLFFKFSIVSVNSSENNEEDKVLFYSWYQEKQITEVQQ